MSAERTTQLAVAVERIDKDAGTFTGVACAYGKEIPRGFGMFLAVAPGAFAAQVADPARVKVLWQHNHEAPIGRISALYDSESELAFEGRIIDKPTIPHAQTALELLREGILDEVSVGFGWGTWTSEDRQSDDGELSTLITHTKARLQEISVVTWGAMGEDAQVSTVHSEQSAPERTDAGLEIIRHRLAMLNS